MSYLGSKGASGCYQKIVAAMPPHDVYIEAFLGSGVVMRNKPPSMRSIGIDLDETVLSQGRYPDTELHCGDAVSYLDTFDYGGSRKGRVLIYADPPFLLSTRTSTARYKFEYTDDDHHRLIECLKKLPASVMLSGYPSTLYDELLADWRSLEFQVMTRGGVRTEKLWMNYEADSVHWSTFAGQNFKDRQRIKRKAERWASNYAALPANERIAILAAMLDVHSV